MRRAIYSGTFDPITNGHLDIIKRALKIFDEIIVAVADSSSKKPMFELEKRVELVTIATQGLGVKALPFHSLLVDFAKEQNIQTIIRGLRAVSDFEFELQMGYANQSLDREIDTIYLMPSLENAFVSSSVVREVFRFGGDIAHLVPESILKEII